MSNARNLASLSQQPARLRIVQPETATPAAARAQVAPAEPPAALALPNRGLFVIRSANSAPALHPLAKAFSGPGPAPAIPANVWQGAQTLAEARRIVAQIEQEIETRALRDRNNVRARLFALEAAARQEDRATRKPSALRAAWHRLTRAVGL